MRRGRRGGLVVAVVAAGPFVALWALTAAADHSLTTGDRLDAAIWLAVLTSPWMLAVGLLWRAWRRAGAEPSDLDGPGWLLAAAAAALPDDRREWVAAMAAELAQVAGRAARWRFAAGCARAALFPPGGGRAAVLGAGVLAVAATVAAGLVAWAAVPAMRLFAVAFVGLVGGLATLAVARRWRVRLGGPGPPVAGLALAGVAVCLSFASYYLAEHPFYDRVHPPATSPSLRPASALALAILLAGCLWLALAPPRWLLASRPVRWLGLGMAVALAAGFVLTSRLAVDGAAVPDGGVTGYLLLAPILLLLPGSALAAAVGRSFPAGLRACAWAVLLGAPLVVAAWLAEGLHADGQDAGLLLDGEGVLGVGANLGDAIWWTLGFLVLWAVPFGVIGAAAGGASWWRRRAAVS